jgi:hypothetical protein
VQADGLGEPAATEVNMKRVRSAAVSAALVSAAMLSFSAASNAQSSSHPALPPAITPEGAMCVSSIAWQVQVKNHSEGVSILKLSDIGGVEAKAVVDRVNSTPPATDLTADHVIVLGARALANRTPSPYVLVAFFNHDCLVASGRADPEAVAKMIGGESI